MSGVYKWISLVVVLGLWVAVSECQETVQEGEATKDATALIQLGDTHSDRSAYAQAIALYEQALALYREMQDRTGEGRALTVLGQAYYALSQYEQALALSEEALAIHREVHNRLDEGITLSNLGLVYMRLSQYKRALALSEEALAIHREVHNRRDEGITLSNMGLTYAGLSQYERAIALYEQALALHRAISNRRDEGSTLTRLGNAYALLSQYERALALSEEALAIHREVHNRLEEGITLDRLGNIYKVLSQYERAIALYEQALALHREVHTRAWEGITLNSLGNTYAELNQNERAIALYEQALALHREVHNRASEGITLDRLGNVYAGQSQYEQAITLYEQALAIHREIHSRGWEGSTLNNLGNTYAALGQYEQAIALYEQALAIHREVHNRRGEGITLGNLGRVYAEQNQYEQAITLYEQALTIHREIPNRWDEGYTLRLLGRAYAEQSQYERAIALYEQALALHREIHSLAGEGITLSYLGRAYAGLSQYERAITLYEQALAIHREFHIRRAEGFTLANLMEGWKARGEQRLAIFYGKLAVNVYQAMRADLRGLDAELQQSFLASDQKTSAYRTLADLLITAGRLPEAQQVLDLLKEAEFFDFVRRDAQIVGGASGRATLTPSEAAWEARYQAIADRLAALGTEYGALRRQRTRTATDTERLNALEADLGVARQAFEQFLARVQADLRQAPQPSDTIHRLVEESQGLMDTLRELDPGTVALHTLVSETAYRVILTTPEVQIARETPITAADLNRLVLAFREVLAPAREGGTLQDPRPLARELYQMVVAPVAQDLHQAHAQTLLWSLDGVLRYLPLAALHDGEQYLLERYRLVVFTPASHTRLKDLPRPQWTGLGVGVSKAHEYFAALPAVPDELRGIIRDATQPEPQGVLPGTIQLDEAFTAPALRAALREGYPVVHIASHFQFRPGDETASFLLLGDGSHLTLAQLKTWPQPFQGVDLLTLSACNSALIGAAAEGTEVEGFAVLAQRQGAKAVVATLWAVADKSTQTLMQAFYRLRESQPGLPKVEALRQAQLALLRGTGQAAGAAATEVRGIDLVQAGSRAMPGGLPRFRPDLQAPYAHPFYWAPFLLIGNWR